jgi:hypothetical protein
MILKGTERRCGAVTQRLRGRATWDANGQFEAQRREVATVVGISAAESLK